MGTEKVLPSVRFRVTASPEKPMTSACTVLPDCSKVQVRVSAAATARRREQQSNYTKSSLHTCGCPLR